MLEVECGLVDGGLGGGWLFLSVEKGVGVVAWNLLPPVPVVPVFPRILSISTLSAADFEFIVVPDVFVVHIWHINEHTKAQAKAGMLL